jgi:hypothetical protein
MNEASPLPPAPKQLEEHAARCRSIAASIADRDIKSMYLEMAKSWEDLAALRRNMERMRAG